MKKGFTLAEVLITLTIVGVIASMTIPSLFFENANKNTYTKKFKKAYISLCQSIMRYSTDNGCIGNLKKCDLFKQDGEFIVEDLLPYFNVAKNCGTTNSDCMELSYAKLNASGNTGLSGGGSFMTTDGIAFQINDGASDNDCTGIAGYHDSCISLYVDINGKSAPNQIGRDVFSLKVLNSGKVFPDGADGYMSPTWNWDRVGGSRNCLTTEESVGWGCAARIVEKGWVMDY